MATYTNDINDGGLPRILSGLGQTTTGQVFDDGPGTVMTLSQGVRAPHQVKQMQMLLNTFGYKLTVDGIFGAGSTAAVKAAQAKLSMSPTGVYDKALDARITGMNQSGVIDATPQDVKQVAVGQSQPQTPAGTPAPLTPSTPGQQGSGLTVAPVLTIQQQNPGNPLAPPAGASFMDKVKVSWLKLQADPHFKFYAAGAVVVAVTGVIIVTAPKPQPARAPSPMNGYKKSRKSRR